MKPLNGIQRNMTGSKTSMFSTKFVFLDFFGPIGKTRWPPWPLIGWDIFNFSIETAERNSTKLDRKQDFNVLFQACVFRADWKNKMAVLASNWRRHCRLLLWNHWMEFNETWQEARLQPPLPSLCFLAEWKNKMAALASEWLRHVQLLLYQVCVFHTDQKTRWLSLPLIGWYIFYFSSETFEWNSMKLDRKQDLKVLYHVCIIRADH